MNMIHVNRDRQNLGQFTPEDISAGLASGQLLPTDLGWREGMDGWKPLSTFSDLPAAGELVPPTLAPGSPLPETEMQPAVISPAWERDSGTLFTRAYESVREVLSNPRQVFASMPVTGGFRHPLIFLLVMETICGLVSMVYSLAFEFIRPRTGQDELTLKMSVIIYVVVAIFLPLIIAIGSFISAGILHVCLMIVGAAPKSFEATYRVICYANGATSVFLLIPICGSLVQAIWNFYAIIAGFREVHGTTTGKAVFAVLLPGVVCCGLAIGLFALAAAIPALSQAVK
jgi:hypothetical protein